MKRAFTWHHLRLVWWYGCLVAYLFFFAYHAIAAWKNPLKNWDMIPYMATALEIGDHDAKQVYADTMKQVKEVYPAKFYTRLTEMSLLASKEETFTAQLPFYRIKPLYVGSVYALHRLGLSLPAATYAPSIIGFVIIGLICFLRRPEGFDGGAWWLMVCALGCLGYWPLTLIAGLSTPDVLSIALLLCGFTAWVYRRSAGWYVLYMILAQLCRPDALLLILPMTVYFNRTRSDSNHLELWAMWMVIIVCTGLYFAVNRWAGNYGWKTLFYYKFIAKLPNPGTADVTLTLSQYLWVLRWAVTQMAQDAIVISLGALSAAAWLWHRVINGGKYFFSGLLWLVWALFAVRFAIFPAAMENRYYFAYYFIMLYASAELLAPGLEAFSKGLRKKLARPRAA